MRPVKQSIPFRLADTLLKHLLRSILLLATLMTAAFAQAGEHYTIGMAVWSGYPDNIRGFRDGLAEAGLIEGDNLTLLEGEKAANTITQRTVVHSFLSREVDLIYSLTTPGTSVVKEIVGNDLPIVFSIVTYPADSGLIESFEYSGNNLVGTSNYVPLQQYLKLLRLISPQTSSAAIFHRKGEPNSKIQSANLIRLLRRAGIKTFDQEASDINELKQMALSLVGKTDLLITTTDTLIQNGGEDALIEISLVHKIPILSSNKAGIINGSAFGPVADFYTLGKISGIKAARILKDKVAPASLQTEYQNPPLFLANRSSLQKLNIELSPQAKEMVRLVD
ncbi:ABC transporter substrate-binding protein [Marinobacterium jannaschii]|uniref:ABC transporter substrate-binding protein n=1 Tax=Marinobacterium jannaschii TaxID=64970 RepID=UPI00048584F5|nr:ABC transporter substrate-binding protein [Marinobacterium jannaschii]